MHLARTQDDDEQQQQQPSAQAAIGEDREDDDADAGDLFGSDHDDGDDDIGGGAVVPAVPSGEPLEFALPQQSRPAADAKLYLVKLPNILRMQVRVRSTNLAGRRRVRWCRVRAVHISRSCTGPRGRACMCSSTRLSSLACVRARARARVCVCVHHPCAPVCRQPRPFVPETYDGDDDRDDEEEEKKAR